MGSTVEGELVTTDELPHLVRLLIYISFALEEIFLPKFLAEISTRPSTFPPVRITEVHFTFNLNTIHSFLLLTKRHESGLWNYESSKILLLLSEILISLMFLLNFSCYYKEVIESCYSQGSNSLIFSKG